MKKYSYILAICSLFCLSFSTKLLAQDEAIFGHYMFNPALINPAYMGFEGKHQLFAHYRSQWTGFPGAPQTFAMSYNGTLSDKVGLGGLLLNEKFGALTRTRGQLAYAYRYVSKEWKGSLGFSTEFHRSRLDPTVTDSRFTERGDRTIEDRTTGIAFFDASVGATAVFADKLTIALSSPNLIRARLGRIDNGVDSSKSSFLRQFMLLGAYKLNYNQITLEPALLIRKAYEAPFEVDFNLRATFMDRFMAGTTIRPGSSGALSLHMGIKQSFFQIYYSYNTSIAQFKAYDRQSHEVTIGLEFQRAQAKAGAAKNKKKTRLKSR